ncbi:hypothetical protein BHM03_00055215 [Ensete ventricosum]|uniref:Uncharacterized protein n=1 Tax=Ensete ventricosum TaxID=4639 RepID=A0A445MM88_ENSVE|nr:hypothetical protein BHM03_00055215 [Ensete ventricosum]
MTKEVARIRATAQSKRRHVNCRRMSSLVDRLLHRYSLAHFNEQLDLWRAAAKDVEITYAKRSRNLIAGTTTMAFIHPAIDSFCIWRHAANDDENRWEEVGLVMSPTHPPSRGD